MKPRLAVGEVELTHQSISVRHLDRLVGGLLVATSPRVAWAMPHYAASPDPWL